MTAMNKFLTITLAAVLCLNARAQDLNPEVRVTNEYETRMSEVRKSSLVMSVPDSLTSFSTAIDYSVFPTDYKGAYEFVPYFMEVVPEAAQFDGNRFYLKAGAGYSFHPTLRLVYTPFLQGLVRAGAYASLDGYAGRYQSLDDLADYTGYNYSFKSGVNMRANANHFDFAGNLSYNGIYADDFSKLSKFHNVTLDARFASNDGDAPVVYSGKASVFYSRNNFESKTTSAIAPLSEAGVTLSGSLTTLRSGSFALRADMGFDGSFSNLYDSQFSVQLAPKAVFNWDFASLQAGFRVAFGSRFGIFPDVHASTMFGGNALKLYLDLGGGQKVWGYTAMKNLSRWLSPRFLELYGTAVSAEALNALLGLRGMIAGRLQYDLSASGIIHDRGLVNGILNAPIPGRILPNINYQSYKEAFVNLKLNWESRRLSADADAKYRISDLPGDNFWFDLPSFEGKFGVMYNWNGRIFAGTTLNVRGVRHSAVLTLPAYCDWGINAEYDFPGALALWAKVGNLLGQQIANSPTHVESGVYFTAGIILKLK